MQPGVDLLGCAMFQNTAYKAFKVLGPKYAIGYFVDFPNGFGDPFPLIERLAGEGLCNTFRGQGSWDDGHKPERFFKRTIIEGKRYDALALRNPQTKFFFSTGCEHRMSPEKAAPYIRRLAGECPHLTVINSPDDAKFVRGVINEIHGKNPRKPNGPFTASPDGTIITDWGQYKQRMRDALLLLWWIDKCNGNHGTAHAGPRKKRTNWPSVEEIVQGARRMG